MCIYKDSPVSHPHFLLCKVRIVNLKKIKHGKNTPTEHPKGKPSLHTPRGSRPNPRDTPSQGMRSFFPSSPAKPKTREGLTPPHATLVHSFLVLFRRPLTCEQRETSSSGGNCCLSPLKYCLRKFLAKGVQGIVNSARTAKP